MKNNKGITLIALVITIIVLLILSGISIAMLTGSNGILQKATEADVETARGEACDRINIALNGVFADLIDAGTLPEPSSDTNTGLWILQENGMDSASLGSGVGTYSCTYVKPEDKTTGDVVVITWNSPDTVKYGENIVGKIEKSTTQKGKVPYKVTAAVTD